jgi:hypothetical protein
MILGRRYCPNCLPKISAMTGATRTAVPATEATRSGLPGAREPSISGWRSACYYLALLAVVVGGVILLLSAPMAGLRRLQGARSGSQWDPLNAEGLGLQLWAMTMTAGAWGLLIVTLSLTALAGQYWERRALSGLGLRWDRSLPLGALLGLTAGVLVALIYVGIGLGANHLVVSGLPTTVSPAAVTAIGFAQALALAGVQEIALRGYAFTAVHRAGGARRAVLLPPLLSVLIALPLPAAAREPLALLGVYTSGVFLGSLRAATGTVWTPWFAQTALLTISVAVFGMGLLGSEAPAAVFRLDAARSNGWAGETFGPESGMLYVIVLAAASALVATLGSLAARRRASRPESGAAPAEGA